MCSSRFHHDADGLRAPPRRRRAEDVPAIGKKLPARRRQAHAAVGSGEEACANLLFKYLNLLA